MYNVIQLKPVCVFVFNMDQESQKHLNEVIFDFMFNNKDT